jgi:hypothetical protein
MVRETAVRLCDAGIVPIMLVHDAILLEESNMETIEYAKEIMEKIGSDVLGGFKVDASFDQKLIGGARYSDKRAQGKKLWKTRWMRSSPSVPYRRKTSHEPVRPLQSH